MNTFTAATVDATAKTAAEDIFWTDASRAESFSLWLAQVADAQALDVCSLRLASADASFRRYFRVNATLAGQVCSRIIMDAPPDKENCQAFVKVARLMADAGLHAPAVLAWDEAAGFMLLSDLGMQTMMEAIAPLEQRGDASVTETICVTPATDAHHALYLQAIDALIRWQLASKPGVLPAYDDALLSRELGMFPDWYVAKHRAVVLTQAQQAVLHHAFGLIKDSNLHSLGGAQVFVHRDFMARNLMVAPTLAASRTALPPEGAHFSKGSLSKNLAAPYDTCLGLGILDFQDAVYGPITYDIASLMRDAFLTWPEDFVIDITVRYWQKARLAGLPVGDDFGEFYRAVEWMGLQRHLKILGNFARLTLRDGKPRYLADTPRFVAYVRAAAARYRQLGPLMVLLDTIEGNETRIGYTF